MVYQLKLQEGRLKEKEIRVMADRMTITAVCDNFLEFPLLKPVL